MSKGSKRPSWKTIRNRYNAISRELAAAAATHNPKPITTAEPMRVRRIRPPAQPKPERVSRPMTEREAAIREWYLYGDADVEPPEDLTDEELMRVRQRFCR